MPAQSPKFRVGDEVLAIRGPNKGERGEVKAFCNLAPEGRVHVKFPETLLETDGCTPNGNLELALRDNTPKPEFPVGEEVEVTASESIWFGWRGRVIKRLPSGRVHVDLGAGNVAYIHEQYLRFTTPAVEAKPGKPVRLIGITGRKRAGKDTVAARLVEKYGFKRMAFADNVRKVALAIDPLIGYTSYNQREPVRLSTVVDVGGWEWAKELPEVRRLLQRIGTEGIRSLEPDFWIRQVLNNLPVDPVVITDVRFPNEADAIKAAGGVVIRVDRPGLDTTDQHSSESAMDDYRHDEIFTNRGTIEDLHAAIDKWVADGFPTV